MLTRALLVLLAMMTGLAAGPAAASARMAETAVSVSVQAGGVDAARAEARVVRHAHLAVATPRAEPAAIPLFCCELTDSTPVDRGDRARE